MKSIIMDVLSSSDAVNQAKTRLHKHPHTLLGDFTHEAEKKFGNNPLGAKLSVPAADRQLQG